jgi:hypothetical protein
VYFPNPRCLLYVAVCFIVAVTPTAKGQENLISQKTGVQEDYDKFKDKTFVSVGPQYLTLPSSSKVGRAWFSLMFSFEGSAIESEPLGYTFGLGVIAAEQPLGSDRRLIILADGKRVFDDEASLLDTRNTTAGVYEMVSIVLPPYVFRKIAAAKIVEAQIAGLIEFQFSESSMKDIKELDRRSKPRS